MNPLDLLNMLEFLCWFLFVGFLVGTGYLVVSHRGWGRAQTLTLLATGFFLFASLGLYFRTATLFYLEPNRLAVRFIPDAAPGQQTIAVEGAGLQERGIFDVIYTYDGLRQNTEFNRMSAEPFDAITVRDQFNFAIGFDVNVEWEIVPSMTMYVYNEFGPEMGNIRNRVITTVRSVTRESFAELGISTDDFRSADLLSSDQLEQLGIEEGDAELNVDENVSTQEVQEAALRVIGEHWQARLNEALEGNIDEYLECIEASGNNTDECVDLYTGVGVRVTEVLVRNPDFNDQWEALVERANNARLETQAAFEENERDLERERGQTAIRLEQEQRDSDAAAIQRQILIDDATAEAEALLIVANAQAEAIQLEINAYGSAEMFIWAEAVRTLNPRIQLWLMDSETIPILPFTNGAGEGMMIPLTGDQALDVLPSDGETVVPLPDQPVPEPTTVPSDSGG